MALILALEIMGKKSQVFGVPWNMTIFSLVASIFPFLMYLAGKFIRIIPHIFQHWWGYDLVVTFICGLGSLVWFVIPESPRWLIDNKKFDEVRSLIKYASDVNNKEIKDEDLEIDETLS